MSLLIRMPRADEADALGRAGFAGWEASDFGRDDAGRVDRGKLLAEFIDFCRDKPETILAAFAGDGVLGWGARETADHVVSDLWVAPQAQGLGIGAALLQALEAVIAKDGFAFSELETYAGNAGAVRFYQRHGYQPVWRGLKYSASLNYDLEKIRFRKPLQDAA